LHLNSVTKKWLGRNRHLLLPAFIFSVISVSSGSHSMNRLRLRNSQGGKIQRMNQEREEHDSTGDLIKNGEPKIGAHYFRRAGGLRTIRPATWVSRCTHVRQFLPFLLAMAAFLPCVGAPGQDAKSGTVDENHRYEVRAEHNPDGIGKFFMGREIAHVMGHQAADWLERPEREKEERPDLLLPALKIKPGDAVADIGAGTGYYTRRLAKLAGEKGVIYAVDIQQEMLDLLTNKMAEIGIRNVRPILGTTTDAKLPPGAVDLILLVDVYHEFDFPFEMTQSMVRSLKPEGRIVFVEFRGEDPKVPIKPVHKMTEAQVRKEMSLFPLKWKETIEVLPWQHIIIFQRPRE
jgi:protein-L-isoaspartate O-methyltransferase